MMMDELGTARYELGYAALGHGVRPDQLHDQGGHHQMGGHVHLAGLAELLAFHAALDQLANDTMADAGHFFVEEAGDFGKVAGFCDDQLDDAADMRLAEAVPPVGEHVGEQLFVAAGGLFDALPELLDDRHDVDRPAPRP